MKMSQGEKVFAGFVAAVILLGALLIAAAFNYTENANTTFVQQCNKAGGTAVIAGVNKCYRADHLLYSDEER